MRAGQRGVVFSLVMMAGGQAAQAALPPCSTEAIEAVLRSAPEQPLPTVPGLSAEEQAKLTERVCGPPEARRAEALLAACEPGPAQAVLHLGVGRCLQQAGNATAAARRYQAYLAATDSVSEEQWAERRARVQRWLAELGQPPARTATLVVASNLRGAVVKDLAGYEPYGLVVDAGETRVAQPAGARRLRLLVPGFQVVDTTVELEDRGTARVTVDWRPLLLPRYRGLLPRWDDFARSGLTPEGYESRRWRPLNVALALLAMGGGATVIGVCASGAGGACDTGWKEGLAYAAGGVLALAGVVGLLGALVAPPAAMPSPGT